MVDVERWKYRGKAVRQSKTVTIIMVDDDDDEEEEQGWHSGESTRIPLMSPGFKSRRRSLPCSERFLSGYSGFPSPQKSTLPNSFSIWNARTRFEDFLRTPKSSVGKEMSSYNFLPMSNLYPSSNSGTGTVPKFQRVSFRWPPLFLAT